MPKIALTGQFRFENCPLKHLIVASTSRRVYILCYHQSGSVVEKMPGVQTYVYHLEEVKMLPIYVFYILNIVYLILRSSVGRACLS